MSKFREPRAKHEVEELVRTFNEFFKMWQDQYSYGANFRFKYDPDTGRKSLEIMDIAPIDPNKPKTQGDARILSAGVTLEQALKEIVVGTPGKPASE